MLSFKEGFERFTPTKLRMKPKVQSGCIGQLKRGRKRPSEDDLDKVVINLFHLI